MENPSSSCESPELQQQGHNPYGIVNYQDFLQSLETLRSMTLDQVGPTGRNSDKNNASSSGSNSNGVVSTQQSSVNSVSVHESIWGDSFSVTQGDPGCFTGESLFSNVHNHEQGNFLESIDHRDRYKGLCGPDQFAPSTSNYANQFNSRLLLHDIRNNDSNFNFQRNQNGSEFLAEAERKTDDFIKRIEMLVDECEGYHFNLRVEKLLLWESDLFIEVAFYPKGANSIVNLIRKLKKSRYAFTVTNVLSTRFLDIITHHTATRVIRECFVCFGNKPNEILYERAISHSHDLATHKVGCISLNDFCISSIAGQQRSRLLNSIADIAGILSYDQYGNYVLQRVMRVNNNDVNTRIIYSLRGQFIKLAQSQVGSNIVERCMEISETGMIFVVYEIVNSTLTTPCELAQHPYGNYIIQKALLMTKKHSFSSLYYLLVESLEPHFQELNQTAGGRNVIALCRIK